MLDSERQHLEQEDSLTLLSTERNNTHHQMTARHYNPANQPDHPTSTSGSPEYHDHCTVVRQRRYSRRRQLAVSPIL